MFDILDISASGLTAQRIRMDTVAGNVLHMNTTRNEAGEKIPYRRRFVVFQPGQEGKPGAGGVHVSQVGVDTKTPFQRRFEPNHPDAGPDGYVEYPNVDLAIEYVNMMEASRAYEANITIMETTKAMINAQMRLLA
jgi:flagellar basal-body rod protein FlgC